MLLNAPEDGAEPVLGVVEESNQQLHLAVARSAPEARKARVEHVGAFHDCLDCVAEGELLVVVAVDSHFLASALRKLEELVHQGLDLLAVHGAEAVDDVDGAHFRFHQQGERFVDLAFWNDRRGHQVECGLVAFVMGILDHVERQGDLVDVGCDPDHVEHALIGRKNVFFVIALFASAMAISLSDVSLSPTIRRRSSS